MHITGGSIKDKVEMKNVELLQHGSGNGRTPSTTSHANEYWYLDASRASIPNPSFSTDNNIRSATKRGNSDSQLELFTNHRLIDGNARMQVKNDTRNNVRSVNS